MISENYSHGDIDAISQMIKEKEDALLEDTATGGPSGAAGSSSVGFGGNSVAGVTTSGIGSVVSAQPSAFPGALNGTDWINGGGSSGSGDISIPYNPSGKNRVFHKMESPMGKNHGSKTGKKSRNKRMDIKALKDIFSKKKDTKMGQKRVMSFDDYLRKDITNVTKIKEGKASKATRNPNDQSSNFKSTIQSHIKSFGGYVKTIGDDFEMYFNDEMLAQIMFRPGFIGFRETHEKFAKEYKLNELGKIKSRITSIFKEKRDI